MSGRSSSLWHKPDHRVTSVVCGHKCVANESAPNLCFLWFVYKQENNVKMPPVKVKGSCCVPHCPNVRGVSKKQFFKVGANLENRQKWMIGKTVIPKSQIVHCCEDHFDLPNDAVNYIRCKYTPGTRLKIRPKILPHRKLPVNVCRLCLDIIYNDDITVDISAKHGYENAKIVAALLPEIDFSLTIEPVACLKCFEPLQKYYKLKQNVLKSEIVVVNCIKSIVKRSPRRLLDKCEIDLFDEYNEIKEFVEKEKEKRKLVEVNRDFHVEGEKPHKDHEEILIQVEEDGAEDMDAVGESANQSFSAESSMDMQYVTTSNNAEESANSFEMFE
ncbi:hypothetical protein HUJ04_006451 [Dendroctonus ponderosae]|nr:hypothetical protein HUJ04_006451 [Dendroctonus ponderosae]